MKQREQTDRVEQAMNSLDGIQRAEPRDWLYARVKARLEQERSSWYRLGAFLSRPVIAAGGLLAIVLLNGFLLLGNGKQRTAATEQGVVTENEYLAASNSSFEYENLVQP